VENRAVVEVHDVNKYLIIEIPVVPEREFESSRGRTVHLAVMVKVVDSLKTGLVNVV
jgi:hypothetical protein